MPGIVGLFTRMPRSQAERQVRRMMRSMQHHANYSSGTWSDESAGVYLGWTAARGSFAEGMPLESERGGVTCVFAGEDFRDPSASYSRQDSVSHNPASYLLRLYEDTPEIFPENLNGRFHGVVVDRLRRAAILFNDRFGMHRVYYHEAADGFFFAAEAKAILAVRPELRTVDPRALGELIACGCVLDNRTVYRGIRVLPPGTTCRFSNGVLEHQQAYFEPSEWERQSTLEPEAYYREVKEVFARILPRYFSGPEKVGMSLTGGLDTRMIMAWDKSSPGALPCYTWGGTRRDCQDVIVARKVARICQQPHQVITVGGEFLKRFDHYAERAIFLTDGNVDASMAPDVYMNEQARTIAPVRLTGLYGGEVLRRVIAFKPMMPLPGLFAADIQPYLDRAAQSYAEVLNTHPLSFAVFRQAPWHHYGCLSLEQTQVTMRSPFLDNDFVKAVFKAPESACVSSEVSLRLIEDGMPALRPLRTDRGVGAGGGPLLSKLTHSWMEFLFKAEYAYDYGMPHWLAQVDRVIGPLQLERLFLGRHKAQHFRIWYKRELSSYVRAILLDPRTLARPYLDRGALEHLVNAHIDGRRNYTTEIHRLLGLELLHRQFVDVEVGTPVLDGAVAVR
jgi:asparagine synthase (glutamine-hydrolysing)